MDDTLRNVAIAFGALLAIHIGLGAHAHDAAKRQIVDEFHHSGSVQVQLRPSGLIGLELNDFASVNISGNDIVLDHLPFYRYPRSGWKGSIHHLRLRFNALTLAGYTVTRFDADIPHVGYDLGHAFYRGHLVIREAGMGPAEVRLAPADLDRFLQKKYNNILSDVIVSLNRTKLTVGGRVALLGTAQPFRATGRLLPREGRYLDLVEPQLSINGTPVSGDMAQTILGRFNPVLDVVGDLGLGGFFEIDSASVEDGFLIVAGHASLSTAPPDGQRP